MNVTPYTSPNDPTPFNPNASGGGNGGNVPVNAPVPDLAVVWTTPPDFTPQPDGGSSSGNSNSPTTPATDLSIDLGSLRGAEQAMLDASRTIVDSYESLKSLFQSGKDTVFGQQATYTQTSYTGGGDGESTYNTTTNPDPIQASAQQFANGQPWPGGQPGMNDVEAYALQQIGNAMALIGEFIVLMNAAGSSYAQADKSSTMPPPPASS